MVGPGKYDHAATVARASTRAAGVILIVFHGAHGHGFACQLPPELTEALPRILRHVADDIERDLRARDGA